MDNILVKEIVNLRFVDNSVFKNTNHVKLGVKDCLFLNDN